MANLRFKVLDGWRGISITLVLIGHLLPVGPKAWRLNEAVAATGMVIFFILSGFLIVTLLLKGGGVGDFLIRRFMRIVPLAWTAMALTLGSMAVAHTAYLPHLLFFANLVPGVLNPATAHLWSLCMEVQFYLGIAILLAMFGRRALWGLPVLAISVTAWRIKNQVPISIQSQYRLDEILAGCILALGYHRRSTVVAAQSAGGGRGLWPLVRFRVARLVGLARLAVVPPVVFLPLLMLCSHPAGGALNYARPYVAMFMIGNSLFHERGDAFTRLLRGNVLGYLATTSYAVYVVHGCLAETWLASGEKLAKYLKRPLLLAVTFGIGHLSTFMVEKRLIALGKQWAPSQLRRRL
jgi:peptidoglycan/LPS O-acetylase OafA/YrhL